MNAADVMTCPVITITPDEAVADAVRLMLRHRISGLPVVDDTSALVGMLTEGDLLRRAETGTERKHARWLKLLISPGRLARDYTNANGRKVGEVMSSAVIAVAPNDSVEQIVGLMERHRIWSGIG